MDSDGFDALARSLASHSRREIVKTFAAAATGGLLALAGAGRAAAHHRLEHWGCTPLTCKMVSGQ
jgi:hypothetical protein